MNIENSNINGLKNMNRINLDDKKEAFILIQMVENYVLNIKTNKKDKNDLKKVCNKNFKDTWNKKTSFIEVGDLKQYLLCVANNLNIHYLFRDLTTTCYYGIFNKTFANIINRINEGKIKTPINNEVIINAYLKYLLNFLNDIKNEYKEVKQTNETKKDKKIKEGVIMNNNGSSNEYKRIGQNTIIENKANNGANDKREYIHYDTLSYNGILEQINTIKPIQTGESRDDLKNITKMYNIVVTIKNRPELKKEVLKGVKNNYKLSCKKSNTKIIELKEFKDKPLSLNKEDYNYLTESDLYLAICYISEFLGVSSLYDSNELSFYELDIENNLIMDIINNKIAYNEETGVNFSVVLNRYLKFMIGFIKDTLENTSHNVHKKELKKESKISIDELLGLNDEKNNNQKTDIKTNKGENNIKENKKENNGVVKMDYNGSSNEYKKIGQNTIIENKASTTNEIQIVKEITLDNCLTSETLNLDDKTNEKQFKLESSPLFSNLRYYGFNYHDIYNKLREYKKYLRAVKRDIRDGVIKIDSESKEKTLKQIKNNKFNLKKLKILLRLLNKYDLNEIKQINKENYRNKKYDKKTYDYINKHICNELLYYNVTQNNLKYDKKIIPLSNTTGASRIRGSGFIIDSKNFITLYSFCNKIIEFDKRDNSFKLCSRTMNPPKTKYNKQNKATFNTQMFKRDKNGVKVFDLFNKELFFSVSSSQLVSSYLKYLGVNKKSSESGKKYLERVTTIKDYNDFKKVKKDTHNNRLFKAGYFELKKDINKGD